MALSEYEFLSSYNKLDNDVAEEFYMPCMRASTRYDRISGYFGSTVYLVAWDVLKEFINNGGKMRIICSPFLSDIDKAAIETGVEAKKDEIISAALLREIEEMIHMPDLENPSRLLACMIANGIIEIRIAIVKSDANPTVLKLYHDKAGVFSDEFGNAVAFRGSFNETFKGLSNDGNIESADVFQSWDYGKDAERIHDIERVFTKLWNDEYDSVSLYTLPSDVKEKIISVSSGYKWEELLDEIKVTERKQDRWSPSKTKKSIKLKKHQYEALNAWELQEYKAIYQGCTGCGKTIIAISAIRHELELWKTVIVLVPSKLLLYHWKKEIARVINDVEMKFLLCGDGNDAWKKHGSLTNWTAPSCSLHKIIIAMMDTASSPDFINSITDGDHLFIVADEVHRMGSQKRRCFFSVKSGTRLGLSATPTRYGDSSGTESIINYFGTIIQPPYTLTDAIKQKVLTPYYYYPESVSLTQSEQDEWDNLSKRIAKQYAISSSKGNHFENNTFLQMMTIERARIIKKAQRKLTKAVEIITNSFHPGQKWLVYCEDHDQLIAVCDLIRAAGIDAYVYYSDMKGDKERTLDYFEANGGVLVSIKCLDEGVDIPSTTHALILASSKNPREFIQRRGRILRKSDDKFFSYLFDVIAVPNASSIDADRSLSIVVAELARAIEFGNGAENPSCKTNLELIAERFGIDYTHYANGGYEEDEE